MPDSDYVLWDIATVNEWEFERGVRAFCVLTKQGRPYVARFLVGRIKAHGKIIDISDYVLVRDEGGGRKTIACSPAIPYKKTALDLIGCLRDPTYTRKMCKRTRKAQRSLGQLRLPLDPIEVANAQVITWARGEEPPLEPTEVEEPAKVEEEAAYAPTEPPPPVEEPVEEATAEPVEEDTEEGELQPPNGAIIHVVDGWPFLLNMADHEARISATLLGQRMGHSRRQVTIDLIERNKEELEIYGSISYRRTVRQWLTNGARREVEIDEPYLNMIQTMMVGQSAKTPQGILMRRDLLNAWGFVRAQYWPINVGQRQEAINGAEAAIVMKEMSEIKEAIRESRYETKEAIREGKDEIKEALREGNAKLERLDQKATFAQQGLHVAPALGPEWLTMREVYDRMRKGSSVILKQHERASLVANSTMTYRPFIIDHIWQLLKMEDETPFIGQLRWDIATKEWKVHKDALPLLTARLRYWIKVLFTARFHEADHQESPYTHKMEPKRYVIDLKDLADRALDAGIPKDTHAIELPRRVAGVPRIVEARRASN